MNKILTIYNITIGLNCYNEQFLDSTTVLELRE